MKVNYAAAGPWKTGPAPDTIDNAQEILYQYCEEIFTGYWWDLRNDSDVQCGDYLFAIINPRKTEEETK